MCFIFSIFNLNNLSINQISSSEKYKKKMHFQFLIVTILILSACARPLPSTKCEVELNATTSDQIVVELTCSLRIDTTINSTELYFHIPKPLVEFADEGRSTSNSQKLKLTLTAPHILLNAISCRFNKHRDDVCFFNIFTTNSLQSDKTETVRRSPDLAANKHDLWRNVYNVLWIYLFLSCVGFVVFVYGHFIFQFK
jgi:hypothetical protein